MFEQLDLFSFDKEELKIKKPVFEGKENDYKNI